MNPIAMNIYSFALGLVFGSFTNVLIYRIPKKKNWIFPRSSCPGCSKKISWYENIPLFSYIFLRGKCSKCNIKIPIRYPLVELILGFMGLFLFPDNLNVHSIALYFFHIATLIVLVAHFFIDLEHKILPDSLNLYLLALFLTYSIIYHPLAHWLTGGAIGFLFPLLITWIFYLIRGQVGLGGGDIKLFGVLGIYLGPQGIIFNIFLSCFIGTLYSLFLILIKKIKKNDAIAFGPFIIIVCFFQIFFPKQFTQLISLFY